MEVFCLFEFGEETTVEFERSGQVVQRLLVVFVIEISFTEIRISPHQYKQILLMNIYKDLADR